MMWTRLLIGGAVVLVPGNALAQQAGAYLADKGNFFIASDVAQAGSMQIERFGPGRSFGTAYGYDFGNGFKTDVESVTKLESPERLANLPVSGGITTTSVMLNGMYEISDGAWRMKPFIGARIGMIGLNQRILGISGSDWVSAYQLRGGVTLGFNQKLLGSLGYQWSMGSKPHLSLAGIPTKVEIDRHGFVLGINYKY